MNCISEQVINELIIKNSKFITILINIDDSTDIELIIEQIKKDYPKATHYCYAYITPTKKKSSDDGEPGGTAGLPMLNVLEHENITNVLAITVRYFGGIKLGAGGLVRAYSKSVKKALEQATIEELTKGYIISLEITYDNQKQLEYLLKEQTILNKEYLDKVKYEIAIKQEDIEILNNYSYKIIREEYIKKSSK